MLVQDQLVKWFFLGFLFFGDICRFENCVKMIDYEKEDESEKWCVVCSDSFFGYYYGVNICEGCKSFFKRIV